MNRTHIISVTVVVVGVALIGFTLWRTAQERTKMTRTQQEIQAIEEEAARIAQQNQAQREQNVFFATDLFKERELKEKMNYGKDGEKVVIVQPAPKAEPVAEAPAVEEQQAYVSNYTKWWRQFFPEEG